VVVADLGNKLDYQFGKAGGNKHNREVRFKAGNNNHCPYRTFLGISILIKKRAKLKSVRNLPTDTRHRKASERDSRGSKSQQGSKGC